MTNDLPPLPDIPPPPAHTPKPATKRRLGLIAATITAVALAIGGTVYWISRPSYDDIANNCVHALKARTEGDKKKPAACDGLKEDDYQTLLMAHVIDELGWTDDDGNFDKNKMLEDTLDDATP